MKTKMKEPIGYQVVDSNGDSPAGMWSWEVYPLKTCLEAQAKDEKRWRLLPIYEDTIEEPTIFDEAGRVVHLSTCNN